MSSFLHFILCNHFQQMFGNFVNRHVLTKIKVVKILSEINPGAWNDFQFEPKIQTEKGSLPCFDEKN